MGKRKAMQRGQQIYTTRTRPLLYAQKVHEKRQKKKLYKGETGG